MEIHVDSLDFTELTIVDMNGEAKTFNIHDELKLSEYTIQQEMYTQSSKYAFGVLYLRELELMQKQKVES